MPETLVRFSWDLELVDVDVDNELRLIESGVRMVQVYYAKGDPWDAHTDIYQHRRNAKESDQPFAAVIKDLKSRGLFDDTLAVCATEFGRTPVMETGGGMAGGRVVNGRDHNPFGFSIWLAGAGIKDGMTYGATDDFGLKPSRTRSTCMIFKPRSSIVSWASTI